MKPGTSMGHDLCRALFLRISELEQSSCTDAVGDKIKGTLRRFISLMSNPSAGMSGNQLRGQVLVDLDANQICVKAGSVDGT